MAALFVEYEKLADDDPRRSRLREQLINGYRPLAKNIANRYRHRGENVDDLEKLYAHFRRCRHRCRAGRSRACTALIRPLVEMVTRRPRTTKASW